MRWLAAVGCALWAAAGPSGRCGAAEHVFVVDGQPARMQCGAAPPGWQRPELDDRGWNVRTTVVERRDNGAPVEADALTGVVGEGGSGPASSARNDGGVRGGVREGGAREGGVRENGAREGGARENGVRASGARDGGAHDGNAHDGNAHSGNARDGNARDGNARDGSARDGNARDGNAHDANAHDPNAHDGNARDGNARDGGAGTTDGGVPACAGARFARWHFSVGRELPSIKTITLRIRYTHGFAAYVNGAEIARRRLEPAAPPDALATDVHGPEYESFTVPAGVLRRGDNLLAVEVHPHTAGRDTTVELSLCGNEGARLVRGPYLIGLREREVELVVDTPMPTWARRRSSASVGASRRPSFRSETRRHDATAHHLLRAPD